VKSKVVMLAVALFLVWGLLPPAVAMVEWNRGNVLKLKEPPVDIAVSSRGRWIFVLTQGGEISIYSADGRLEDTIVVGDGVDDIEAGAREEVLLLTNRKAGTIEKIHLEFIQKINTKDSPFKGPADAPVVVCVFTDFQ